MPPPASNPGYTGDTRRLGFFDTTRVGYIYGQGDGERIVRQLARTCHINFSSLKMGAGTTAKAALDYAFREGEEHGPPADPDANKAAREQADKAAELECTAGERQDVEDACARIEESAVVRKGRTAERFLIQQVIELPGDSTAAQRKACAEALVQHWEDRGHPASAAVHARLDGDPKARVQPHVHVQATARPVDADGNVDRSALLWNSKQAVRDEREAVAGIVNEHCPGAVLFHGGRHEDVNIDRAARKEAGLMQTRLPRRAQHRPAQYERDETMPGRLAVAHDRGRSWATAEAERKKAEAARKAAERAAMRQARAAAIEAARQDREARKKARDRRAQAQAELRDLSAKQTAMLAELHKKAGRELPDLEDEAGRTAAWQFAREEEGVRQKRAADEAAARAERQRLDLAAELKQRGRSGGDEAPAPELGEDGKRLLRRLLNDRATAAMLEGEVAGMAAGDGAAASPEARQRRAYARRAADLREREAKRRSELAAELEPQLGMDAAAGVEALVAAGERQRQAEAAERQRQQDAEAKAAERQRQQDAEAADAAERRALLAGNPYAATEEADLRKAYRKAGMDIGMHRDTLAEGSAWKVHEAERANLAAAEKERWYMQAAAQARGIDLAPGRSKTAKDKERGDGR